MHLIRFNIRLVEGFKKPLPILNHKPMAIFCFRQFSLKKNPQICSFLFQRHPLYKEKCDAIKMFYSIIIVTIISEDFHHLGKLYKTVILATFRLILLV
jgi:hypothetical protein